MGLLHKTFRGATGHTKCLKLSCFLSKIGGLCNKNRVLDSSGPWMLERPRISLRNSVQYKIQIKLRWALFVTYTIIQSIMRSEMCSLHLTHPSGAVGSRHCSAQGAVGGSVPCSRVSPQSWTLPARARIRTHNLGLPRVSSPMLYPLGHGHWNQAENCAGAATSWLAKIWCKTNSTKSKRKFSCFHVFSNFQSLLKTSKMFWHRQSIFEACWRYLATCLCELIKMMHSVYLVKKFKLGPVL